MLDKVLSTLFQKEVIMKFKKLINEDKLDPKGNWVTFSNGHRTHIASDGEVETGKLKGVNLKNKKQVSKRIDKLKDEE